MLIPKAIIVATLRERGKHARADFVERDLPDMVDTDKNASLLSTLNLELKDLADKGAV